MIFKNLYLSALTEMVSLSNKRNSIRREDPLRCGGVAEWLKATVC